MSVTEFGIVWFILILITFFAFPLKRLAQLVIISCIFQAAAVASIGNSFITPLLFTSISFILKCIILDIQHENLNFMTIKVPIWGRYLLLFVFYSVIASIIFPYIFKGVTVFPMSIGIDTNVKQGGAPLNFSSSNILQVILLLTYTTCTFYFYKYRKHLAINILFDAFCIAIGLVLIIGFWSYASSYGLLPFPNSFFYSNSSFSILTDNYEKGFLRFISSFTEASTAAAFLVSVFWGIIVLKQKKYNIALPLILLALVSTMSGTGFMALIGGLVIYILLQNKRYTLYVLSALFFILILLFTTGIYSLIIEQIIDKFNSQSGLTRTYADFISFKIWINTYLLGVGLGSHRSSSFLLNMLAAVGITGTLLLGTVMFKMINNFLMLSKHENKAIFFLMFAIIMTLCQVLANPDLSSPTFWMWIFAAATIELPNMMKNDNLLSE